MHTNSGQPASRRDLWIGVVILAGLLAVLVGLSNMTRAVAAPPPTPAEMEQLHRQLDDLQRQSDDLGRRIQEDIDALQLRQRMRAKAEAHGTDPSLVDYAWDQAAFFGVYPPVYLKQIDHESNWDKKALNHNKNGTEDRSLPQINSLTWPWLAAALHLTDPWDPKQALKAGAYYMAVKLREYDGNYDRALTAYNRGDAGLVSWEANRGTARSPYSQAILARTEE